MRALRHLVLLPALLLCAAACRGQPLPEPVRLTLPRAIEGTPFTIQDRKGEATIVFFFSTWCVLCQAMEPFVGEAARLGPREGIEVIAIALDHEGQRTVAPYVAALQPDYPVLIGGAAVAEGRSHFGRIGELPSVIFLDAAGRPASLISGVADTDLLLERARDVRDR